MLMSFELAFVFLKKNKKKKNTQSGFSLRMQKNASLMHVMDCAKSIYQSGRGIEDTLWPPIFAKKIRCSTARWNNFQSVCLLYKIQFIQRQKKYIIIKIMSYFLLRQFKANFNRIYCQLQRKYIKPLQKKSSSKTLNGNDEENMNETWHFCSFHAVMWGTLQSFDGSTHLMFSSAAIFPPCLWIGSLNGCLSLHIHSDLFPDEESSQYEEPAVLGGGGDTVPYRYGDIDIHFLDKYFLSTLKKKRELDRDQTLAPLSSRHSWPITCEGGVVVRSWESYINCWTHTP